MSAYCSSRQRASSTSEASVKAESLSTSRGRTSARIHSGVAFSSVPPLAFLGAGPAGPSANARRTSGLDRSSMLAMRLPPCNAMAVAVGLYTATSVAPSGPTWMRTSPEGWRFPQRCPNCWLPRSRPTTAMPWTLATPGIHVRVLGAALTLPFA
jgi:hypothetical protein